MTKKQESDIKVDVCVRIDLTEVERLLTRQQAIALLCGIGEVVSASNLAVSHDEEPR